VEALDQDLRAGIDAGIEPLVGMAVTGEKPLEPQDIAVIGRAHDHRAAAAGLEQADPAQDQGPHDPLAELGLFHHQIAQPPGGHDQRLDRLRGDRIDQRGAAGKLCQLAHERARRVGPDGHGAALRSPLGDIDSARQDDEGARGDLAGREDAFARRVGSPLAEP